MKYVLLFLAHFYAVGNPTPAKLDPAQMFCVATAVYHEARGEVQMGKVGVAWSVKNRVKSDGFPSTPCEAVYEAKQYTDIHKARPDYQSKAWKDSVEAAVYVFAGYVDDPTKGARFYYNPKKTEKPTWTKVNILATIGQHVFWDKGQWARTDTRSEE